MRNLIVWAPSRRWDSLPALAASSLTLLSFLAQSHGIRIWKRHWRSRRYMTIIMVMDRILPLANVKAHLSEIVDQVESAHDRVILTRNGRPAAVILSPDDLEALEETLDLLSQPGALEEIQKAREALDAGKFLSGPDLRARFGRR